MRMVFLATTIIWMSCWAFSIPLVVPADSNLGISESRLRHDFVGFAILSLIGAFASMDLRCAKHWRVLVLILLAIVCSLMPFRGSLPYVARAFMIALCIYSAVQLHLSDQQSVSATIRMSVAFLAMVLLVACDYLTRVELGVLPISVVHERPSPQQWSVSLQRPSPDARIDVELPNVWESGDRLFRVTLAGHVVLNEQLAKDIGVGCVQISSDQKMLTAALNGHAYAGSAIQVWRLEEENGAPVFVKGRRTDSVARWGHSVDINERGNTVAFSDREGVHLWNLDANGQDIQSIVTEHPISAIRFSHDGRHIAGYRAGAIQVWDIHFKTVRVIEVNPPPLVSIGFSSDGRFIRGLGQNKGQLQSREWKLAPNMTMLVPIYLVTFAFCVFCSILGSHAVMSKAWSNLGMSKVIGWFSRHSE